MSATLEDWVALAMLPGLGPMSQRKALQHNADPGAIAYRMSAPTLATLGARNTNADEIAEARRDLRDRAAHEVKRCRKHGIRLIVASDPGYPPLLAELPGAPIVLWVRGELPHQPFRMAVVGSRHATGYGRRIAAGLAAGLARRKIEVVSGGARGIDSAAHLGALEEGGRTVAVLGSGLLHLYPEENEGLFARIAAQGALVSEFPLDTGPHPGHFPRRNRLISGLASAVIVVEAAAKSGSLITAAHALDQGREVLAVPGPVESRRSEGCHRLIQQGAKLVHCIEDIVEELPPQYRAGLAPEAEKVPCFSLESLDPDERALWAMLDPVRPLHLDELADGALFGIPRLQAALFGLELHGAVERLPGGYFLRRHHETTESEQG